MKNQRSIKLCLFLFVIGMLLPPGYTAPVAVAQASLPQSNLRIELARPLQPPAATGVLPAEQEEPLPHDCEGITPPGEPSPACCLYGYAFYVQTPLLGASVLISSPHGSVTATTAVGGASSKPYYSVNLSAPPLSAAPGEAIIVTASYGSMTSVRAWTVQSGGQQVDVGLIANYRMTGPASASAAPAADLVGVQPSDVRPMAAGGAPFGDKTAIAISANGARAAYAADVDGDGDLDVLAASFDGNEIAWYENDGNSLPTFTMHIITSTASGARSVYAADVNGDGHIDVLSASANDDTIAWYKNDGSSPPTFAGAVITNTADGASAVYAADVDGDGDVDVLSASANDDTIAWYENLGGASPTFTAHIVANTADGAASVYAADVNRDGRIDVLSASANDDKIAWYENLGGLPLTFTEHVVTNAADGAASVYAADMDDDGHLDILSASANDNKIAWYKNDGGSTPAFAVHVVTTTASGAASVYAADVDRDGDVDILSASANDDKVAWYESDGGASPAFAGHAMATAADGASSVYAADVDGDGDIDILSASVNDNTVAWYPNLSIHRSASFPVQSVITNAAQTARSVYAADLDGDGDMDILSASFSGNTIAWYENQGGSVPTFTGRVVTTTAMDAVLVYAADVDGDRDMDILSASCGNDTIAWYENDGGSPPTFIGRVITNTAHCAASVYTADVDGDGDQDVLTASRDDNTIAWYQNVGGSPPVFVGYVITNTIGGAISIYAADVDGDGDADILSAAQYSDTIAWHENLGGLPIAFTDHIITASADDARQVYAADVDRDGDMDALSVSHSDNKIAWYENTGGPSPTFTAHTLTTGAIAPRSVYVADLDNDGDMDVLSASRDDDKIAWYENDGGSPPTFITHTISTQADAAWSVYAADLDGDGDMDVMSASNSDNKIAWYANQGGQFALTVADTAPFTILPDQRDDLLRIAAAHRGRTGDLDTKWLMLKLRFEDILGDPLTADQANALVKTLYIYRDDGSGNFEPISDTLVTTIDTLALVTGTQVISFAAGDPNARIAFGTPMTYFVAIEPTDGQIWQTPNRFRVTLPSSSSISWETGSMARYWDYDLPLAVEGTLQASSRICAEPAIYSPEITVPFGIGSDRTFAIAWADADRDSFPDLAVANHGNDQVCWNNGDGSFSCNTFDSGVTFDVDWGDLNGDDWPDMIVAYGSGQANQICLNNQNRTFTCTSFSVCSRNPGECRSALGDVDQDGDVDIVLGTLYPDWIAAPDVVYYNQGDGTFPVTTTTCNTGSTSTRDLKLGDLNNDGYPDLVVADNNHDYLCINHDGVLSELRWLPSGVSFSTALGDADSDGDLDIAMGGNFGVQDRLYLNDGSGLFPATVLFHRGQRTYSLAFGDIDGDGRLDLASGDYYQRIVYLNVPITTTPGFTLVQVGYLNPSPFGTSSVAFTDIDRDGDLDLAEGRDGEQNVVYVNLGRLDAAFTASPLTGMSPLTVEFADQSTGSIVAWTWTFGDGSVSGARHPAHIYEDAGLYTVSLTISGIGGTDTETKTNYVTVLSSGSYPPVAGINFIWHPSAPGPAIQGQDLIYFNGSGRDADENGGRIVAWLWSSSLDGPLSAQEDFAIEAAVLSTGAHTIAFKVQDDEGDWSLEVTRTLIVQSPPPLQVRTLILVNQHKLASLYGDSEADQVSTTLRALAAGATVGGEVVQVEDDPAAAAAYAAWDAEPTSSAKANAVAEAIKALIVSRWQSNPYLEYLVLVGDDRVIPFRRVPDRTREPESHYTAVSASTTVGAALHDDMVLTDDYYADVLPNPPGRSGGASLYIPDLGIGRLIEDPGQIMAQITAFLASDEITVDSAAVSGYDFLKDSAQAMCDELQREGVASDCLIGEGWGPAEFTALVLNTYHDVALINGHANHYLIGTPTGNISADQIAAEGNHTGAIWGNSGCHSGLNVPPEGAHDLDLAEAVIRLKALYIGNTGYGWGYKYGIGLSEQLMLNLTERLARGQSATVGQALVAAKHRYYLADKSIDAYDEKILIESTLYGLPMVRYAVSGALPLPAPASEKEDETASEGGLIVIHRSFEFSPCTRMDTADGSYYVLDGQVYVQEGEPIQPGYTADVLLPNAAAHGIVFRGGVYTDVRPFDPVIAQAMTETSTTTEPIYQAPNWGPAQFYALNRLEQRDSLAMLLGQFSSGRQTERLYRQQDFDVYYHTGSDDWTAPAISAVTYTWQTASATVTVTAGDASGVYAVAVAYTAGNGVWESVYLRNDGQAWTGSFPIKGSTEFFVQAVDKAGNVVVDDHSGAYYGIWRVYMPWVAKYK